MAAPLKHRRYGGRTIGTLNKTTAEIREILDAVLSVEDWKAIFGRVSKLATAENPNMNAVKLLAAYRFGNPVPQCEMDEPDGEEFKAVKIQVVYADARKSVEEKLNRLSGELKKGDDSGTLIVKGDRRTEEGA